jgi:hypothetical protein
MPHSPFSPSCHEEGTRRPGPRRAIPWTPRLRRDGEQGAQALWKAFPPRWRVRRGGMRRITGLRALPRPTWQWARKAQRGHGSEAAAGAPPGSAVRGSARSRGGGTPTLTVLPTRPAPSAYGEALRGHCESGPSLSWEQLTDMCSTCKGLQTTSCKARTLKPSFRSAIPGRGPC